MGIGDFGVGQGGNPYTYGTSEFLGNFSWKSLDMDESGVTSFSDQLNVVLQFVQGGTTYAYWIQDVAFMDSSSRYLQFENNIWNFTTGSYCLSNSALSGNGTVYPISGCEGYYAVSPTTQPGASLTMPSPGDFSLFVRSYLSGTGVPEVEFAYWDGVTSYEVPYDNVLWPWAKSVTVDNNFYVDGNATAPSGNFYDAELTIGGPGNGAATVALPTTDTSSRLLYWNGHNLEAPRAVWNFGADTAEAISSVQSFFSHDSGGTPLTTQLNGTARNATPALAYDQGRVGVLAISAPGLSSGTVSVAGTLWNFESNQATLTLVPGSYPVWVNTSSEHNALGRCTVVAGQTTSITLPGGCLPSVSTPTGSPSSIDLGQAVTFRTTVTSAGSGGDTFDWNALSSDLGCTPSTTDSISCTPTTDGTFPVAVNITDSDGNSSTSGTLSFTIDADPTVGSPVGAPTTVETGASVTITASPSGGSGGYSFAWTNLPTPCAGTTTSAPVCQPSIAGDYTISVGVTDSNAFYVKSPALTYTVKPGPELTALVAAPADTIDLGQTVNFSISAYGGTGSYTFAWQNLPAGCLSADAPYIACVPSSEGSSSVSVTVVDSGGGQIASPALPFTVDSLVEVDSVAASPVGIDLGEEVTFSAAGVSGGSGSYTYVWSALPAGCTSADGASVACYPTEAGTFEPNVTVTDSAGGSASIGTTFTVNTDPSIGDLAVSRASADVGQSVTYSTNGVSGGAGGDSFAWTGLPAGCVSANAPTITCAPSVAGKVRPTVTVTDVDGGRGNFTVGFTVFPLPAVGTPTSAATPAVVGVAFEIAVNATPGSGELEYAWAGLPTGCSNANSSTLSCTPTVPGVFAVVVTVVDSNGGRGTSSVLSLTVGSAATGISSLEELLLIGGAIAVVAVAVAAVVALRRRKQS